MLRGLSDPHTGVLLRIQSEGRTFTKHKNKDQAYCAIKCKKKKEDWNYRGAAGEGGSFSENDQWWNSEQQHVRIGISNGKNNIRMESLKSIKSKRISDFSVSEDHIILGFSHEKNYFSQEQHLC